MKTILLRVVESGDTDQTGCNFLTILPPYVLYLEFIYSSMVCFIYNYNSNTQMYVLLIHYVLYGSCGIATIAYQMNCHLNDRYIISSYNFHLQYDCIHQFFILFLGQWALCEPHHDKTNKMGCAPSEDSDQPGHPPSLIRVFAVRLKKAWVLSYPISASENSDQTGRCPG